MSETFTVPDSVAVGDRFRLELIEEYHAAILRDEPGEALANFKAGLVAELSEAGVDIKVIYSRVIVVEDFLADDYEYHVIFEVTELRQGFGSDPLLAGGGKIMAQAVAVVLAVTLLGYATGVTLEKLEAAVEAGETSIQFLVVGVVIVAALFYFGSNANRALGKAI